MKDNCNLCANKLATKQKDAYYFCKMCEDDLKNE